ncbi:MAG: branched-chain amino acid ABC transporter permease [Actinobacteria bacterium]|nr:branched-chain amino acid ABC transporter permease [Actinomycetota bacterium]
MIRALFFAIAILLVGTFLDPYNQSQLSVALIIFIAVLSITLLTGASGQISLGQGALMAVGGYASALTILNFNLNLWLAIPIAVLVSALAGLLLGVTAARLSGPYLAGTTLVIALAIPSLANRFESVFAGEIGFSVDFGSSPAWLNKVIGDVPVEKWQLIVTVIFATIALFFALNILNTRTGRSWRALRDHDIAASLQGVNVGRSRIFIFMVTSAFAGMAGALYGLRGIVSPSVYAVSLSLSLLTAAILGGIRNISGAMIGSIIIVFLPDWIGAVTSRLSVPTRISDYLPALITGLLLVATVVLSPGGLSGSIHHKKHK